MARTFRLRPVSRLHCTLGRHTLARLGYPLVCGLLLAAAAAQAQPLAVESVRVFKNTRGDEVDLVMLQPLSEGRAVIRVTGTASALDGLALPYQRRVDGPHEYYTTEWRGRRYSFVQVDHRRGDHWELYVPGDVLHGRAIALDESLSKALQAGTVLALHGSQLKDGTISRFAAFHRDAEQAEQEKSLRENVVEAEKACATKLASRVNWGSISDEVLKRYAIASFCSVPVTAMAALCKESKAAATLLAGLVKEVSCSFTGFRALTLAAGKLEWQVDTQSPNQDEFARQTLEGVEITPPVAIASKAGAAPPWGDAHTLGQRIILAGTGVCTDKKNHYVVSSRSNANSAYLYYGDGKQFSGVALAEGSGGVDFFEPRYFNARANSNIRGQDYRLLSAVEFDSEKQTCSVRCGTRSTGLSLLPAASALEVLTQASFSPPRKQYVPHALTRDDTGIYYYVDKGSTPETAQQFRLFVGPKGGMKLQRMSNIVSDSQGEIFSTKTGALRFIVGPQGKSSTWVKGTRRTELLAVPIDENWNMIWNDLGVYTGERRGTPCDDL